MHQAQPETYLGPGWLPSRATSVLCLVSTCPALGGVVLMQVAGDHPEEHEGLQHYCHSRAFTLWLVVHVMCRQEAAGRSQCSRASEHLGRVGTRLPHWKRQGLAECPRRGCYSRFRCSSFPVPSSKLFMQASRFGHAQALKIPCQGWMSRHRLPECATVGL